MICGGLLSLDNHETIGLAMILGIYLAKDSYANDKIITEYPHPTIGLISSLIWLAGVLSEGLNQEEMLQCFIIVAIAIRCISNRISQREILIATDVILSAGLALTLISGLMVGWSFIHFLAAISLISLSNWDQYPLDRTRSAAILWGCSFGMYSTLTYLQGGFNVDSIIEMNEAHARWILFIGGPLFGAAVFETIRALVSIDEEEEE